MSSDLHWLLGTGKRLKLPVTDQLIRSPRDAFDAMIEKVGGAPVHRCGAFLKGLSRMEEAGGPLRQLESCLRQVLTSADAPTEYWCVVHGDLNVRNVLCGEESGDLWVIDFAKTDFGPPAIDFVVFEMACRLDLLAGPLAARFEAEVPSGSVNESEWLAGARRLLERFERSTVDDERLDLGALSTGAAAVREDARIKRAWQAVLTARRIAFESFYREPKARRVYGVVLALYCLRALQRYRTLVTEDYAPFGALWIQVIFERTVSALVRRLTKRS
ncbi:MAG: phosphotransferase [Acidobacteria bacterium]|nr:phosphotransferase [Acidobacteriota bacterium]MBA3887767.1 phosphotransferase [Acidobacteriota bacterium]